METFAFTLVLLEGLDDAKVDALFEAGCDDASFGCVDGVCFGDFDREAETLEDAIASAMAAVESVPGLTVVRVEPDDLVTMSEIAQRLGRTRESVRLLIAGERGPGMFPPPVSHLRTHNRLWRWNEVAGWARDAGIAGPGVSVEGASLIAAVNAALQMRTVASPAAKAAGQWSVPSAGRGMRWEAARLATHRIGSPGVWRSPPSWWPLPRLCWPRSETSSSIVPG